jgi:hypothetical protein
MVAFPSGAVEAMRDDSHPQQDSRQPPEFSLLHGKTQGKISVPRRKIAPRQHEAVFDQRLASSAKSREASAGRENIFPAGRSAGKRQGKLSLLKH